jgi:tetratricopeptide (TPR) repeat protein
MAYPEKTPHLTEERFVEENIQAEKAITSADFPEAARILVDIVDQDPTNWRAYNNLGILSWARECWKDAYIMFMKAIFLRPDYVDALINLFDASLKLRSVKEIMPLFEKALSIKPDNDELRVIYDTVKKNGDDIYVSQRALAIGMYSPLIEQANKALQSGDMQKALDLYLKSNDEEGESAEAFCGLGIISFHQERFRDAFMLFVESIKLNPMDTDTFLNLFDAAKKCGLASTALEIYNAYRKEFPVLETISDTFEGTETKILKSDSSETDN